MRVEREERKVAEVTAQGAHFRADKAETELVNIRAQLRIAAEERDKLAAECGARDERIAALNSRVAELETEVCRLEALVAGGDAK